MVFDPNKPSFDLEQDALCKRLGADSQSQLEQAVSRLAELSPMEYEAAREGEAKKLKCRVSKLDNFVKEKTTNSGPETKGRAIHLYEPEPWPEPVNGEEALAEAASHILRHMVISESDAYACVLWSVHTHLYNVFGHTPRLLISAPLEECGKSLLMTHMCGNLITKPQSVELMTPAPFFRLSEQYKPTFLIDEVDIFIKDNMELLAAINNGWEPHGGVPRCVGDDLEVRIFSTHCPMAMAGINIHDKLPKTTVSRSVVIILERASPDEAKNKTVYNQKIHKKAMRDTGRKIARWCLDNRQVIKNFHPVLPEGVINRKAEKWSPLFTIAQVAGGIWPGLAIKALNGQTNLSEPSKSELLLQDMKRVIRPIESIHTEILIERLCGLEDSLWKEYNFKEFMEDKKRIGSRQLANLLKAYSLKPKSVSVYNKKNRGYHENDLRRVFSKYLSEESIHTLAPGIIPVLSATPPLCSPDAGCRGSLSATPNNQVADREPLISPPDAESGGVADRTPYMLESEGVTKI